MKKIGVYGSATGKFNEKALRLAAEIGKQISDRQWTLVTGASPGVPFEAVKAAHQAGGKVIGFSPALDAEGHREMGWSLEEYDELGYVPKSFEHAGNKRGRMKYRNLTSTFAVDAGIIISGQYGTLNEFSLLYDFMKPIGILTSTGGFADLLPQITLQIVKEPHPPIVHSDSPTELLDLLEAHL